eukprot:SM000128S26208  [mRNA]  locus=s128:141188:144067:+ [translate_table: standard]
MAAMAAMAARAAAAAACRPTRAPPALCAAGGGGGGGGAASRARVQAAIRQGLVSVDGTPQLKASYTVRPGERVACRLAAPPPLLALPEDLPLDIVFEDAHLLVVNKPAHMVVHPAAGHRSGTLVNALLGHCSLPAIVGGSTTQRGLLEEASAQVTAEDGCNGGAMEAPDVDDDDEEDEDSAGFLLEQLPGAVDVRPGIVHRLDKGTTGLLVVAKDEHTHTQLCDQFKARTVRRSYLALTVGVPNLPAARIVAPLGRDPHNRKQMTVLLDASPHMRARHAASRNGWRLETGRTHQIRVHAKHIGRPILGDELYGGTGSSIAARVAAQLPPACQAQARALVAQAPRPFLHAQSLQFVHPWSGQELGFSAPLPADFASLLQALQSLHPVNKMQLN